MRRLPIYFNHKYCLIRNRGTRLKFVPSDTLQFKLRDSSKSFCDAKKGIFKTTSAISDSYPRLYKQGSDVNLHTKCTCYLLLWVYIKKPLKSVQCVSESFILRRKVREIRPPAVISLCLNFTFFLCLFYDIAFCLGNLIYLFNFVINVYGI